jgi:hypothetical protein
MRIRSVLSATMVVAAIASVSAQTSVEQRVLAEHLLSADLVERSRALSMAGAIPPREVGPDLRAALIAALERVNALDDDRRERGRRGETLEALEDPEFIARVAEVIISLRDPQAIPALAGALHTGAMVARALAMFGEEAAPSVLSTVTAQTSYRGRVNGGLLALRFMMEANRDSLGTTTVNEIRRAAEQRLTGNQFDTVLWRAMDLAVILDDPGLERILEILASDRSEVEARGIDDPQLVDQTQQRAIDRLAGVPALPRP